jgi:hypothetical protein
MKVQLNTALTTAAAAALVALGACSSGGSETKTTTTVSNVPPAETQPQASNQPQTQQQGQIYVPKEPKASSTQGLPSGPDVTGDTSLTGGETSLDEMIMVSNIDDAMMMSGSFSDMGGLANPPGVTNPVAGATPPSLSTLRSVQGSVARVDPTAQSITLDQAAGSMTLSVDSSTMVLRNGKPLLGIESLREGQKVRASFNPATNRASRIEVVGSSGTSTPSDNPSSIGRDPTRPDSSSDTVPPDNVNPGNPSNPSTDPYKPVDKGQQPIEPQQKPDY